MKDTLEQANTYLKEGDFERAVEGFTASLSSELKSVPALAGSALRGRGIAYFQLKNWKDAISDFSKARDLDPEDLESGVGLGMSLAMDLQIYPAIDVLETLLQKHPDFVRGHIQLGFLYFRLAIIAKGRAHLEQALTSRPTLTERRLIEKTLKEQKQMDKKRFYRPDFEALRRSGSGHDEKRV